MKQNVILIHGLGGTRLDMWPISRRLARVDFDVSFWSYRSIGKSIEAHAKNLKSFLLDFSGDESSGSFHIVAHSMGGIIVRTALANLECRNLARVVMLAPPNQGSHAARKFSPFLGWLTPSLEQLSDDSESFVNRLPNPFKTKSIEFGIICAEKDRVIHRDAVELEGRDDFAVVNGHHGILPWYSRTAELVENFLRHGKFDVAPAAAENQMKRLPEAT